MTSEIMTSAAPDAVSGTAIEQAAAAWLLDLLALPATAQVSFVTGGTTANFTGLAAGTEYFFAGTGVARFRIDGIETAAGLNPSDPTAFVTTLTFAGSGRFTGTMTLAYKVSDGLGGLTSANASVVIDPFASQSYTGTGARDTLTSTASVNWTVNTLGSKTGDLGIIRSVISMKTEIGKLKEQLQNVE